jgi:hypothetical protein
MFPSIKKLSFFLKKTVYNCSPICAHCEVAVSEKTAEAITLGMKRRAEKIKDKNPLAFKTLLLEISLIKNGLWEDDYDTL